MGSLSACVTNKNALASILQGVDLTLFQLLPPLTAANTVAWKMADQETLFSDQETVFSAIAVIPDVFKGSTLDPFSVAETVYYPLKMKHDVG